MLSVTHLNEMAAIAELPNPQSYESELFRAIDRLVGADITFFKRDGGTGPVVRGMDSGWLAQRERSLLDCRPELTEVLAAAQRHAGVAVDREVFGARELERKEYFQRIVRPLGGTCGAYLPVTWRGQGLSVLVLGRAGPGFRPRELERLQRIAPTLQLCEVSRHAWLTAAKAPDAAQRVAPALTEAERDVLSYLHLGYTNAEIARARSSTSRTVRNQLSSAYAKLGVASRAEAVAAWVQLREA